MFSPDVPGFGVEGGAPKPVACTKANLHDESDLMRDETEAPAPAAPKPELKPANENPWYVLMTLYGEDHEANRRAWNAWAGQALDVETRKLVSGMTNVDVSELECWEAVKDNIRLRHLETMRINGDNYSVPWLPEPTQLVELSELEFAEDIRCDGFVFPSAVMFHGVEFWGDILIRRAVFMSGVNFLQSRFLGGFWAGKSVFFKDAAFSAIAFDREASFDEVMFEGKTYFSAVHFNKTATFSHASFRGYSDFAASVFTGAAGRHGSDFSFYCCRFYEGARFEFSQFTNAFPNWDGAIWHDSTSFSAREEFWPKKETGQGKGQFFPEAARRSCATIRHHLAKQGRPEDEHFFFRREMHFAGKIGSIWQRLPYLLFGLFSEYGYSILRPTLWLLGVWAFGFAAFWGYLSGCCVPAPDGVIERPMGAAMGLSVSNLFPLFGFGRLYFGAEFMQSLPAVLKTLSGLQTVVSLPLLFFLGLGLRQRFRLR